MGKLAAITYPSGNHVAYGYDSAARLVSVTLNPINAAGTGPDLTRSVALITGIQYTFDGQVLAWSWGNGDRYARHYDADGRLAGYALGPLNRSGSIYRVLRVDAANRILGYRHTDAAGITRPAYDHAFTYDDLNRVTGWSQGTTQQAYEYDASGNRTAITVGATRYPYTVSALSDRLDATAGPAPAQTNAYDGDGKLTSTGSLTIRYDYLGRTFTVTPTGSVATSYFINALGQRVRKSTSGGQSYYYAYDETGQTLGEYDGTLAPVAETVFLGTIPVAVLKRTGGAGAYGTDIGYVHADQIDTPRVITRAADGQVVWRWDAADPFGAAAANQNLQDWAPTCTTSGSPVKSMTRIRGCITTIIGSMTRGSGAIPSQIRLGWRGASIHSPTLHPVRCFTLTWTGSRQPGETLRSIRARRTALVSRNVWRQIMRARTRPALFHLALWLGCQRFRARECPSDCFARRSMFKRSAKVSARNFAVVEASVRPHLGIHKLHISET